MRLFVGLTGCAWVMLLATLGVSGAAQAQSVASEYEIKAAFLLHFTDYVEWPHDARAESAPVVGICLLGEDPFGAMLDELVAVRRANGRPVRVQRIGSADAARSCHIVFVRHAQRAAEQRDLARLQDWPVLTVGDHEAFAAEGGVVAFRVENDRVRLTINQTAAERAGLRISSRLLDLARVVQ
ncbi:YfiR family protein [Ectothiorhodospiraceae bacterium 2226]|nr:YfiR family protein [Ectothiorhodospiraceae bacterium 2226]